MSPLYDALLLWPIAWLAGGIDVLIYFLAPHVLARLAVVPAARSRRVQLPLEPVPGDGSSFRALPRRPRTPPFRERVLGDVLHGTLIARIRSSTLFLLSVTRIDVHVRGAMAELRARTSPPFPLTLAVLPIIGLVVAATSGHPMGDLPAGLFGAHGLFAFAGLAGLQHLAARSRIRAALESLAEEIAAD